VVDGGSDGHRKKRGLGKEERMPEAHLGGPRKTRGDGILNASAWSRRGKQSDEFSPLCRGDTLNKKGVNNFKTQKKKNGDFQWGSENVQEAGGEIPTVGKR